MKPVILGAGLASLSSALSLAPMPVTVISPCSLGDGCSSALAQGGIAAAVGANDEAALHAKDTLAAGVGLNDPDIVRQTTNDGAAIIERLTKQGVVFDRDAEGKLLLGLEAAHGKRRIVHAKDATGAAVMLALIKAARAAPSIEIIEHTQIADLIVTDGAIAGVLLRKSGKETVLPTSALVLATGGAAALWRDTTNPHENWGGGLALAARAGATLADLEFLQFHPTAIDIGRDPMPLASEALRGEGAVLINEKGEAFTDVLQRRDVVTRAIWDQMTKGHKVFLDAREAISTRFAECFPSIFATCLSACIDPSASPIPVRPAAHYHMGGVQADARGRTDVAGLWACGEAACTGFHGANRLASNSLLEAASFGGRVAEDIKNDLSFPRKRESSCVASATHMSPSFPKPTPEETNLIRSTMSDCVGVIRDKAGLTRAIDLLSPLAAKSDMALVGLMIATSALRREESRGAHFRSDYPQTNASGNRSRFRLSDL
jgi:L-aspartate oxidase